MQLEAVTPAHRSFPVLGQTCENHVHIPPDVMAHGNHAALHERDTSTFAKSVQFHEKHHQKEHPRHLFDKAVV